MAGWLLLAGFRHLVVGVPSFRITMVMYVGISGDFEAEEDDDWACGLLLLVEELKERYDSNFDVVGDIKDGVSSVMRERGKRGGGG